MAPVDDWCDSPEAERNPGERAEASRLLAAARSGGGDELARLFSLVYGELRRLAGHAMRHERADCSLQPTALVHEAYLRLTGGELAWQDRAHFLRLAGQAMRRVLVDHARARRAAKRQGNRARVTLAESRLAPGEPRPDVVELDEALSRLARHDPRKANVVELHFFVGLSYEEVAEVLEISPATVHRDMTFARAWLRADLSRGGAPVG